MGRRLGAHQADLYAAEHEAIAGAGLRWERLSDAQRYVDRLVASAWFAARWPHLLRCAVERRGSGSVWSLAHGLDADGPGRRPTEGVVLVADGELRQAVVLHELAHLVSPPDAGHGPEFARTHLALVRHEMGFFAFADYRRALRRRPAFAGVDDDAGS